MIRPGDTFLSVWKEPHDVAMGSYGLAECFDKAEEALASGRGGTKPEGDEWLEGKVWPSVCSIVHRLTTARKRAWISPRRVNTNFP
jgi:hypothetical protein